MYRRPRKQISNKDTNKQAKKQRQKETDKQIKTANSCRYKKEGASYNLYIYIYIYIYIHNIYK